MVKTRHRDFSTTDEKHTDGVFLFDEEGEGDNESAMDIIGGAAKVASGESNTADGEDVTLLTTSPTTKLPITSNLYCFVDRTHLH